MTHRHCPARGWVYVLLVALAVSTPASAQIQPLLRLNAGGPEASGEGFTYTGDTFFSASKTAQSPGASIEGTEIDALYQTERISNDALEPFEYAIPVPSAGTYTVMLHFAETAFSEAGRRQFDVLVEGSLSLDDYDIFAQAGQNTAQVETIPNVSVTDGTLNISFMAVAERAKVNAIEILGTASAPAIPFALNVGGEEFVSTLTWVADDGTQFLEGTAFNNGKSIEGTEDDALYQTERFANQLRFLLPGMPEGVYTIELHFAETFHTAAGQRLFDAFIEGETVLNDYDMFAQAGANTAIVETFEGIAVNDGLLNITLISSAGSATLNGIAITGASLVSNEDFDEAGQLPSTHRLSSAYPNPFNPATRFSLVVAQTQRVGITVHDLLGRRVADLFSGTIQARQEHNFVFEASGLPSGIYLIRAQGERFSEARRVVLLK